MYNVIVSDVVNKSYCTITSYHTTPLVDSTDWESSQSTENSRTSSRTSSICDSNIYDTPLLDKSIEPCTVLKLLRAQNSGSSSSDTNPTDTTNPSNNNNTFIFEPDCNSDTDSDNNPTDKIASIVPHNIIDTSSSPDNPLVSPIHNTHHTSMSTISTASNASSGTTASDHDVFDQLNTNYAVLNVHERGLSQSNTTLQRNIGTSTTKLYDNHSSQHSASNLLLHGYHHSSNHSLYTNHNKAHIHNNVSYSNMVTEDSGDHSGLLRRTQSEQLMSNNDTLDDYKKKYRHRYKLLHSKIISQQYEIKLLHHRLHQYEIESVLHITNNTNTEQDQIKFDYEPRYLKIQKYLLYTSNICLGSVCGTLRFIDTFTNKQLIDGILSRAVVPRNIDVSNPPLPAVLITGGLAALQSFTPFMISAILLRTPHSIRRNISFVLSVLYSFNTLFSNKHTVNLAFINIFINFIFILSRYYNLYHTMKLMKQYELDQDRQDQSLLHDTDNTATDTDDDHSII